MVTSFVEVKCRREIVMRQLLGAGKTLMRGSSLSKHLKEWRGEPRSCQGEDTLAEEMVSTMTLKCENSQCWPL